MPLSIITASFPVRDPELPWEQLAPGLYPGELGVQLSTGEKVAVSVDPTWLPNGAGVSFLANARWVTDTGQTEVDPAGEHVESHITATASIADVRQFKMKPLAKDLAIVLLGEGARLMRPADAALELPARPVFAFSVDLLDGASIKNALDSVKAARTFSLSLA